ncbi:MAG: transcriptional repressor LexA [Gammaproteobacteria bacterium]|nr:transcriptional repressor LexA [Gammaproteobacteria bacterium]
MPETFRVKLYQYIASYIADTGNSPSFSEMIDAMGISPHSKSLMTRSLRTLEKEGKLMLRRDGRRLLISLTNKKLGLLGRISAGEPIEAIADSQFLDLQNLLEGENRFALQVKGNSMIDEGILDGDIIICRQANTAREGDIVVALIDQQYATLKHISYKIKGMITLIPANVELKPRAYSPDRIHIQGIYVGLIRTNQSF